MKSVLRLACAIVVLSIAACAPYITAPKPTDYVRILPLPDNGTLRDILVRNGKPVGEQDPTTPSDPTVRILHGQPFQAQALFDTLSKGGTPVPSAVGKAVRLRDGAIVTYYENDIPTNGATSVGSVTIFVHADGIPVSMLRFYMPPSSDHPCLGAVGCDGGGDM